LHEAAARRYYDGRHHHREISMSDESKKVGSEDLRDTDDRRPPLPEGRPKIAQTPRDGLKAPGAVENLFRASGLFRGMSDEEVREIVRTSNVRTLRAGDALFRQGEQAEALYIVENGELEVRAQGTLGEEVVLAMLGAGTVVGEMAILEGTPRSATVEALSDVRVFELARADFEALRAERSRAAYKLILNLAQTMGERRRQTDARVEEVFRDPAQHIEAFENQVHDMLARIRKA
jgi:CRP-like cAMP-binding protein